MTKASYSLASVLLHLVTSITITSVLMIKKWNTVFSLKLALYQIISDSQMFSLCTVYKNKTVDMAYLRPE